MFLFAFTYQPSIKLNIDCYTVPIVFSSFIFNKGKISVLGGSGLYRQFFHVVSVIQSLYCQTGKYFLIRDNEYLEQFDERDLYKCKVINVCTT